jgi:signal transduction histidine kinase
MAAFVIAAVCMAAKHTADRDGLLQWVSIGALLAAFARLHSLLYPSFHADWVYPRDAFRLLSFLALLVGAGYEIRRYWRDAADLAVLEERRRIARDFHDGLAQELAFIVRRCSSRNESDRNLEEVAAAAERALDESRRAIVMLSRPLHEPLDALVEQALMETADRLGTDLDLDLDPEVRVDRTVAEDLIRIAREALINAARHGHARWVRVELRREAGRLCLRVIDDGEGFDPETLNGSGSGFGLISMAERAEALGATFRLSSQPGAGTHVEVVLA